MSVADVGAHVISFCEKRTVNNLSQVVPLADKMDVNDFKFLRSPYAIESAGSSVTSRVLRNTPQRHSSDRTEAGAGVKQFETNVHVLESWKPSPIDLYSAKANPNWEDVETATDWENQQRNQSEPANIEEEEGFQETLCSPPGASRCESHPDVEIVSSAPSQPVVPIVELSSDDEMEKPHES